MAPGGAPSTPSLLSLREGPARITMPDRSPYNRRKSPVCPAQVYMRPTVCCPPASLGQRRNSDPWSRGQHQKTRRCTALSWKPSTRRGGRTGFARLQQTPPREGPGSRPTRRQWASAPHCCPPSEGTAVPAACGRCHPSPLRSCGASGTPSSHQSRQDSVTLAFSPCPPRPHPLQPPRLPPHPGRRPGPAQATPPKPGRP